LPKHIRFNLIKSLRATHDAFIEFRSLEQMTLEEKEVFAKIEESFDQIRQEIWNISEAVEKRIPPPTKIAKPGTEVPLFSWAEHDKKAKTKRIKTTKAEKLKARLDQMQKEMEAMQV